jgi:hypothetical protein
MALEIVSVADHHPSPKANIPQPQLANKQNSSAHHRGQPTPTNTLPTPKIKASNLPPKDKKNSCSNELDMIGIAEGGARTHDLEVDLFAVDKSHTLYRLSYPGKGCIG